MPLKVLVAEDDPNSRKLLRDILGFKGYTLIETGDGFEAVERAKETLPDLIFLDLQMPVMDGFEALRLLKADEKTASIPVWVLSASVLPADQQLAAEAGCEQFIAKPVNIADLLARLEKFTSEYDAGNE